MLLLYALARPILAPETSAGLNFSSPSLNPFAPPCDDINKCRTVADILWNCYSVVLLCTWVAIHPNVPKAGLHLGVILLEYGLIVFIALVTPELMVLWALRQWLSSRKVAKKYKKYGWTQCHAFLVIMGGLALYDGDGFITYLWDTDHFNDRLTGTGVLGLEDRSRYEAAMWIAVRLEKNDCLSGVTLPVNGLSADDIITAEHIYTRYSCLLEYLVVNGYINITADEIRDRGNGDALSKTITALQASWFILQCIARALQGLAVTELEVITFAFAVLSFVTSFFWWHKPLRVRRPVRVMLRRHALVPEEDSARTTWCKSVLRAITRLKGAIQMLHASAWLYIKEDYQHLSQEIPFTFLRWKAFAPLYPFASLSAKYRDMIMGYESDVCQYLFSSRLERDRPRHRLALYPVSIIFSAIHCIPWFFTFPTLLEQTLWRIAAVIVVASSISTGILHLGYHWLLSRIEASKKASRYLLVMLFLVAAAWYLLVFLQCIMYTLYVVARLVVIAISLTTLRELPPTAYEAIQWSSFLPHIE